MKLSPVCSLLFTDRWSRCLQLWSGWCKDLGAFGCWHHQRRLQQWCHSTGAILEEELRVVLVVLSVGMATGGLLATPGLAWLTIHRKLKQRRRQTQPVTSDDDSCIQNKVLSMYSKFVNSHYRPRRRLLWLWSGLRSEWASELLDWKKRGESLLMDENFL